MQVVKIHELDKEVTAPAAWSYNAVRIFADKYLAPQDNNNVLYALERVASAVSSDEEHADALYCGMYYQRFAFNSPVYFNAGVEESPQCSACFIQSVDDTMGSILDLAVKEGHLFKFGSGTGTNLSPLRGQHEGLSGGGKASGPVSFMRVYDSVAGIVKSGGKTRRAAKMQILDADHPDIREFIWCKAREERKANDLITKAGYDASFDGEAYSTVHFQNANLSVRVTDDFMAAARADDEWDLIARTTGDPFDSLLASDLLHMMAEAAWECGDPGIQYHDTINAWHTCPQGGQITASNPCSEYMFLPETACNLASLNLIKYLREDGSFNTELFVLDIDTLVTAMDNIVDLAGYPTEEIAKMSRRYRTLGLGFTNLGCLLSEMGLAYDSELARDVAASITALMHAAAQRRSFELAEERGVPDGLAGHTENYWRVWRQHMSMMDGEGPIWGVAQHVAMEANSLAHHGPRNAQLTCLAPTGTISFVMDAITTGIEPLFARRMTKTLAGGGTLELEFDGPHVRTADEVSPEDHLRMMAVCQPFLSGAISKTINMPSTATPQDIYDIYVLGHKLGLKALAVYRDGCKASQPLSSGTENLKQHGSVRHPLPTERPAVTHKFSVSGHDGYVTVGMYEDGAPGEVFINIAKEGSTISGLLDAWAIGVSVALQHGVPLEALMEKHTYSRFEPSGLTGNVNIPMAHSIVDYIARWLLLRFDTDKESTIIAPQQQPLADEKTCPECGSFMQRTGSCYTCPVCGHNGGCG